MHLPLPELSTASSPLLTCKAMPPGFPCSLASPVYGLGGLGPCLVLVSP